MLIEIPLPPPSSPVCDSETVLASGSLDTFEPIGYVDTVGRPIVPGEWRLLSRESGGVELDASSVRLGAFLDTFSRRTGIQCLAEVEANVLLDGAARCEDLEDCAVELLWRSGLRTRWFGDILVVSGWREPLVGAIVPTNVTSNQGAGAEILPWIGGTPDVDSASAGVTEATGLDGDAARQEGSFTTELQNVRLDAGTPLPF